MPNCKYCGSFSSRKFCSILCKTRFYSKLYKKPYKRKEPKPKPIRYCLICNKPIPPKSKKYCSKTCQLKAEKIKNIKTKFCINCGCSVLGEVYNRFYCLNCSKGGAKDGSV